MVARFRNGHGPGSAIALSNPIERRAKSRRDLLATALREVRSRLRVMRSHLPPCGVFLPPVTSGCVRFSESNRAIKCDPGRSPQEPPQISRL